MKLGIKTHLLIRLVSLVFLLSSLLILFYCVNDYNPFEDENNARAVLQMEKTDGDTVSIFSTETLSVVIAVRSQVEKFTLHADSNRYFTDTTITGSTISPLKPGPYTFMVSFCDTGWHELRLQSYRTSGEEVVQRIRLFAVSPLYQEPLSGLMGDSIYLETVPVSDRDVLYHWSFGKSITAESVSPSTYKVIRTGGAGKAGELWVSELTGEHPSSRVPFMFTFTDNQGPVVLCVNEGGLEKDTIIASEKNFFFRVHIFDEGSGVVFGATVNGAAFDAVNNSLYVKELKGIDTLVMPWPLNVSALDPFSNVTQKTFWLLYDSSSVVQNPPSITVTVPSADSVITGNQNWNIMGTIESYSTDSLNFTIYVEVNDSRYTDTCQVKGLYRADWNFTVNLSDYINRIRVFAMSGNSGETVAEKRFVMIYDPDHSDTSPPVLVELTANGVPVHSSGFVVEDDSVTLRVVAFDEGTGIAFVRINGQTVPPLVGGNGYIWEKRVVALHSESGSSYKIEIQDSIGLITSETAVLRQNRAPMIVSQPHPPLPLIAGTTYSDYLLAVDPDNDSVSYHNMEAPQGLLINQITGLITWSPGLSDTGTFRVSVLIKDLFTSVPYNFHIRVVDSSGIPDPVRFAISEDDFPSLLEADKDSVHVELTTVPGTGKPPLTFSVRKTTGESNQVLPVVNGWFDWKPLIGDTGTQQFVISVTDSFDNSATLYPAIRVVPQNRPFTLSVEWSGKRTLDSALDLSRTDSLQTLIIGIDDFDTPDIEQFTISYTLDNKTTPISVDSGLVTLTLNPFARKKGFDTLSVLVKDKAGHRDSIKEVIYYGSPPYEPMLISPDSVALIQDSFVTFRWSSGDPDSNTLLYDLYLATSDSVLSKYAGGLTDTVYTTKLLKAGDYFWKVVVNDGKNTVWGNTLIFVLDPPLRVRLKTDYSDFPLYIETDQQYKLLLQVEPGTGKEPFTFNATANGEDITVSDDTLIFTPGAQDTGHCRLIITVSDSAGNGDTLRPIILIVPPNRSFTFSDSHNIAFNDAGELDLSTATKIETLNFTITDLDPSISEQHTVSISLGHTEWVETAGQDGIFTIAIDPLRTEQIRDTLYVTVTDAGGHTSNAEYYIYYGLPPLIPSGPSPSDGMSAFNQNFRLSWSSGDPDGDPVVYKIYTGFSENTLSYAGESTDTFFMIQDLLIDTLYYWKVVVFDHKTQVEGPIWSFRISERICQINLNTTSSGANIPYNVYNFPLKVSLDSVFEFSLLSGSSDGLVFEKPDGTRLPYEIEQWAPDQNTALIWVLMDTIYGNSNSQYIKADFDTVSDGSNGAEVFGGFEGVWHMNASDGIVHDASGNGNDGTLINMSSTNTVEGVAGSAMSFDSSKYVNVGNRVNLNLSESVTLEAWVQLEQGFNSLQYGPIITKGNNSYYLELNEDNSRRFQFGVYDFAYRIAYSTGVQNSTWYHIVGMFNGSSVRIYVNGVNQLAGASASYIRITNYSFQIGHDDQNPTRWFRGNIDEVRVSSQTRSPSWIRLCYENQRIGSNLLSFEP